MLKKTWTLSFTRKRNPLVIEIRLEVEPAPLGYLEGDYKGEVVMVCPECERSNSFDAS